MNSSESDSSSDDEGPKERKPDKVVAKASKTGVRQTCIIPDASQPILATIAGPIEPWLPCPENLPNHPTMVKFLFFIPVHNPCTVQLLRAPFQLGLT